MQLQRCQIESAQMQDQVQGRQLEDVGLLRVGALSPAGQRSEVSHASLPGLKALTHQLWPGVRPLTILSASFFLFLLEVLASWGPSRPWKEVPLGLTNGTRWAGKRAANEKERPCQAFGSSLPWSVSSTSWRLKDWLFIALSYQFKGAPTSCKSLFWTDTLGLKLPLELS